jgi:hypothetical protein
MDAPAFEQTTANDRGPDTRLPAGPLRIAEIGGYELFSAAAPSQTDVYWSATNPIGRAGEALTPVTLAGLVRRLRAGAYDMVVIHPAQYPGWHPRTIAHVTARWWPSSIRGLGASLLMPLAHQFRHVPMAAIDLGDGAGIERHNFGLLDAVDIYFKRELPADRWMVFTRTGHPRQPGARWRGLPLNERRIGKIRPLSLGHPWMPAARPPVEKTSDVFFAGAARHSNTIRDTGIVELRRLAEEGYRIDIAEALSAEDYLDRMARAWLAWSPAGFGWDCYRHYEAPRVGTVPVMNYPTIVQHQPFVDGVHCFYYRPEAGGLSETIRRALTDKERLRAIAAEAASHVERHHTVRARAEHVAVSLIGRGLDGTPGNPD